MSLKEALRPGSSTARTCSSAAPSTGSTQIARRLEVLDGYIIAYLNLDEVIRIIREEDDAKASLMATFELTDVQAEAILNMRLRSLRKLEEIELRTEHKDLTEEEAHLEALLASDKQAVGRDHQADQRAEEGLSQVDPRASRIRSAAARPTSPTRRRRSTSRKSRRSLIEREPITVILSEKGWIRSMKGHTAEVDEKGFKTGDRLKLYRPLPRPPTSCCCSPPAARSITLAGDRLPGGRGQGEPVRLMVDIEEGQDIVDLFVYRARRASASSPRRNGDGFIVAEDELIANTRKGKQVLNVSATPRKPRCSCRSTATWSRSIGENRKMVVFPLDQLPEMAPRQGRPAAEVQGRRHLRPQDLRAADGPHLDRLLGPHLHQDGERTDRMARRTRLRRPPAAQRLPAQQQVRRADGGCSAPPVRAARSRTSGATSVAGALERLKREAGGVLDVFLLVPTAAAIRRGPDGVEPDIVVDLDATTAAFPRRVAEHAAAQAIMGCADTCG